MEEETKSQESASLDTLYSVALKVLDKQIEVIDSLDSKVRGIFAFITLIYGGLAAFLSSQPQKLSIVSIFLFWIVLIVFIAVVVFSFFAYRVKELSYLTRGRPLAGIAELRLADSLVKSYLLSRIAEQHEKNENLILKKANYVRTIIWLTFAGLLLIIGLILIQTFNQMLTLPRFM